MSLTFQPNGNLANGVHLMTIDEFEAFFGYTEHRRKLISGLKRGMAQLKDCGCKEIYIDGSFVTTKETPNDFDACWNADGVDLKKLQSQYPIIIDFDNDRINQKRMYFGEFFPAQIPASNKPLILYYYFFQRDRDGNPKGMIQINLK